MLLPNQLRGREDLHMVKLAHRFDPDQIARVIPKITDDMMEVKNQQPGDGKVRLKDGAESYHTGRWLSVGLIPPGKVSLNEFPYIREMVEWFDTDVYRVRFLILDPGHKIHPHCGNLDPVEKVRLLLPLQIDERTVYHCGPHTYRLGVGEIWYLNQTHTHSVENNSNIRRIVLSIDLFVNKKVKELFREVGVTV